MKMPTAVTAVILTLIMSITSFSQTRPDFSGKWVLNKAKSKERNPRQFKRSTMEVLQHDPELDIQVRDERPDGQEFRAYLNLKTDGTSAIGILGSPQRAVIRWEGDKMVIRWNMDRPASAAGGASGRQGATPPFTWTWTLSPDGKVLVNETHLYGDVTGDIVQRLVFERAR
jgi:hypothetical protein